LVSVKEIQYSIHIHSLEWSEILLEYSFEDELKKKVFENIMTLLI